MNAFSEDAARTVFIAETDLLLVDFFVCPELNSEYESRCGMDDDVNAGNSLSRDQDRDESAAIGDDQSMVFLNCPLTVSGSTLLIKKFQMRHNLTKEALGDLLQLMRLHFPSPNCCPTSLYLFDKQLPILTDPLEVTYFCSRCIQEIPDKDVSTCPNTSCGSSLTSERGAISSFIEVPLALHGTLDVHFRRLHETGIGRRTKHAPVISKDDESKLWSSGQQGTGTPQSLFNAVFYYNRKNFCLRGGEEHRQLRLSQLKRFSGPDHYIYYENCSKNKAGTFRQKHVDSKVVPVYCTCTESGKQRCHVHLLDFYLEKLPKAALELDTFYMRPLSAIPTNPSDPWFANSPIGRNSLALVVKKMCAEAGIEGTRTNHSLRATGATALFQAQVPEKRIQQRTGHRSLEALRMYERTTGEQHRAVSAILSSSQKMEYRETCSSSSNISSAPIASGQVNFQGLTNCTINVYQQPQKENIQPLQ